ncbi:hypothetical protein GN956_G5047 [Arapaima gigas]
MQRYWILRLFSVSRNNRPFAQSKEPFYLKRSHCWTANVSRRQSRRNLVFSGLKRSIAKKDHRISNRNLLWKTHIYPLMTTTLTTSPILSSTPVRTAQSRSPRPPTWRSISNGLTSCSTRRC